MPPKNPHSRMAIGWKRAARIFGNPPPPERVWEQAFDHDNEPLKRLASTPYQQIDFSLLCDYYHDLAYVRLQPDLFKYLFPVCLMDWHLSLMRNEPCMHGDAEFHHGVLRGAVFERMLTPGQRQQVFEFLRDSFLERLDAEQEPRPQFQVADYGWLGRFNSIGQVVPAIDLFWTPWWEAETPGRACCVLKYCSALAYFAADNPLRDLGTAVPADWDLILWVSDSWIYEHGWLDVNVAFVQRTLTADSVLAAIDRAAERLRGTAAEELARRVAADAADNRELLESRVAELPTRLADKDAASGDWWQV